MKKIEDYLQALQLGKHSEEIVINTIECLKHLGLQELSVNRILIASVYCQLLQYCQVLYEEQAPEEIIDGLLFVFENIERIGEEATEKEKEDSSLITVWFLHELKLHRELGDTWRLDDKMLRQSLDILLRELDNIHFIFEIKVDGHFVFPINDMIAKVVAKPEFISSDSPLSTYHIHILQLAVKLFINNESEQKILQELLDRCNLKFINYLHLPGKIIDTPDLLNHQRNGVMIFYDPDSDPEVAKVLIRHEKKDYFMPEPIWKPRDLVMDEEYDNYGKKIGAFVEYSLDKNDSLVDYSIILKTEQGRKEFLKMIFDKGIYNAFIDGSIIQKADGSYLPVNPFCHNDEIIVKGRQNGRDGKCFDKENLLDALLKYRNSALKKSSLYIMNRVSFGLAVLLLQKENVGVKALDLNGFLEDDWYQNQMMKKWVENCKNQMEALKFILEQWYQENEYLGHCSNSKNKFQRKNIQDKQIEALDFFPQKTVIDWIYQMMGCNSPKEWYILYGKVLENEDGYSRLKVDLDMDANGRRFCVDTKIDRLFVEENRLEDEERLLNDEWGDRQEIYFLYDSKHQVGKICDQLLLKMLSGIENIQENNHLTLQTATRITKTYYEEISSLMCLHKLAFEEVGKRFFCDFDSQVYYRLVHNLVWSNIDENTIDSYLRIFLHHQKMTFDEICTDEKFMRRDTHTLYVPKDGRQSDSALCTIYDTYLKTKGCRETNDLYDYWLELREDGYYHNNSRIENIVFLCDNYENGTATTRMLKAYLDIDIDENLDDEKKEKEKRAIERVKATEHKYYLKKTSTNEVLKTPVAMTERLSQVLLKDVINLNRCTIEVHSYYGTEEGKKTIDDFLKNLGMAVVPSTYERELWNKATQIAKDVQCIWKKIKCGEFYTVVREFNMTKANVFPDEMLEDPKKAICMFVKKKENYLANIV